MVFSALFLFGFVLNLDAPLQGTHTIRQSDTTYAAYSYCTENTPFFTPKIAHRGVSNGVAIGEFPLYSYLVSIPCQVRGTWSEIDPKFFILVFWILNLIVWVRWSRKYFFQEFLSGDINPSLFPVLLTFSTFGLLFMTVSIPDNLAFFLIGVSALIEQKSPRKKYYSALSSLFFILSFAIRPYLIPLIWIVRRDKIWMAATVAGCVAVYGVWYKWWVFQSDVSYYYLAIPPINEIVESFPHYAAPLMDVILREWFQYIFILVIFWQWRKLKKDEVILLFLSLGLVVIVRGEHLVVHSYYMWAAAFFAFLCLFRAMAAFTKKWQTGLITFFALMGVAQTQHQFHAQAKTRSREILNLLKEKNVAPAAKVAVYVGDGSCATHYLYWMKHTGWCFYEHEFRGADHCPAGADYYFLYSGPKPILERCEFFPTQKPSDKSFEDRHGRDAN